jgi:hypothetical protein
MISIGFKTSSKMVATLLRAELAAGQWFKCRTYAGRMVQGGAGDDQRGREA